MSIRFIALDLDRTTLDAKGKLSKANLQALKHVIEKGIHVVVASGRGFSGLPEEVISIPGIEYAITSNGAAIYHIPTKTCIKEHFLPADFPAQLIQEVDKLDLATYECFIAGNGYTGIEYMENPKKFNANDMSIAYMQRTRTIVPDIRAFLIEHAHELNSIDVLVPNMEENLIVQKCIENAFPHIYMTSSFFQMVELSNANSGKANGVRYLAEKLQISPEEIATFGDANNDIDMLRYAGVGIAMENATEECKNAADYITKHHDENGVAWGIYNILKL